MAQYPTPTKEGFYWAKWRIADDGTREGEELTPSDKWEVMHVVENGGDPKDPEYFLVMVPGVEQWQSRENFFWGPGPLTMPEENASDESFRVKTRGPLDVGDIKGFARNHEKTLSADARAFLHRCAETVAALWLENFRLKADGGPGTLAMLAEAGIFVPTEEQVVFASTMRDPSLSWRAKVALLREKWPEPEPETPPKAKKARRA